MFESARIKLTAWYLVIIMVISFFFSVSIYLNVNKEYRRFDRIQTIIRQQQGGFLIPALQPTQTPQEQLDPEIIENARIRLLTTLGLINIAILALSGAAGYFLAGITLRPIKKMVDEQNRFISDASHELRTPITSLRTEIEVALRNKNLDLSESKKLLESNLEETVNLQKLSDNLLELAQNGNLVDSKSIQSVDISDIIQNAVKKVGSLASKKQIKIDNSVKKTIIKGIPDRLTEAFVILLDNAIKYSPKKNSVNISAKKTANSIEILVTDYGIGIDEKDIPHIWDRFYRADKSRTQDGYGLGLSIAKKIIDSHGGTISVKSTPKKETAFKVFLPL